MSQLFKVRQHAGPGTQFGPEAFRNMIGDAIPVTVPPDRTVEGILKAASVADDGTYAELTLEVPDGTLPPAVLAQFSIGFAAE
jgi:hypothetical protein